MSRSYTGQNRENIEKEYRLFLIDKTGIGTISQLLPKIAPKNNHNSKIYKYAYYGLARRLGVMEQCVKNVFGARPFDSEKIPTKTEWLDITINLQCFLIHLYGVLENLAQVYAISTDFKGTKFEISFFSHKEKIKRILFKKKVFGATIELYKKSGYKTSLLDTLPKDIKEKFIGDGKWIEYIKLVRDLLAHQEPFYIPPHNIDMTKKTEWQDLENRKNKINNDYLVEIFEMAKNEIARNNSGVFPTIDEINKDLKKHDELKRKLNLDIAEIEKQQSQYILFVPMLVTDTNDMQQPIMHFYPQMLVDMKTIYEKVILILEHIVRVKNL